MFEFKSMPFKNDHSSEMGPKGKLPCITYNGEDVADSDFIIQFLSSKLGKDLNTQFSAKDLGAARAFSKLVEESLVWYESVNFFIKLK